MKTGTTTTEQAEAAPLVIRGQHLPGPWTALAPSSFAGTQWVVPSVAHCGDGPLSEHNARLIAAAPELLEAAQEFVAKVERGEARSRKSYAAFKAAIAKATGEQSPSEKFESDLSAIKEAIR